MAPLFKKSAQPGNMVLVASALAMVGLALVWQQISSQKQLNMAQEMVASTTSSPLRIVAKAGLNEVLSNRLYPNNNRANFNFNTPQDALADGTPFYPQSSFFMDGEIVKGRYQYLVLGGQGFFKSGQLLSPNTSYPTLDGQLNGESLRLGSDLLSHPKLANAQEDAWVLVKAFGCVRNNQLQEMKATPPSIAATTATAASAAACTAGDTLETEYLLGKIQLTPTGKQEDKLQVAFSRRIQSGTLIEGGYMAASSLGTGGQPLLKRLNHTPEEAFEAFWKTASIEQSTLQPLQWLAVQEDLKVSGTFMDESVSLRANARPDKNTPAMAYTVQQRNQSSSSASLELCSSKPIHLFFVTARQLDTRSLFRSEGKELAFNSGISLYPWFSASELDSVNLSLESNWGGDDMGLGLSKTQKAKLRVIPSYPYGNGFQVDLPASTLPRCGSSATLTLQPKYWRDTLGLSNASASSIRLTLNSEACPVEMQS